ncbi:MAG: molybdate transport system ATP-binding protein [Clostridia bacterium]|nr:molybdate transport system ATP-binding protein [Clostridia bacterium]
MLRVNVRKNWGDFKLQVDFNQQQGELLTILGPSGCGKSTLLNLIAGVVEPDGGEIEHDGKLLYNEYPKINVPVYKRKIGYIQQKSNLFPHLTVMQNIAYGVKGSAAKAEIKKVMDVLGIGFLADKRPSEISGGQQQRVSLARAVMIKPRILLLDEPFSALDNFRRLRLRETLLDIKKKFQIPMIFVTHDLEEAYQLGDRVAVMNRGLFLQIGSKDEVFRQPVNTDVARFVGMKNILRGKVTGLSANGLAVQAAGITLKTPLHNCSCGQKVTLGIRPEDIMFVKEDKVVGEQIKDNIFSACVIERSSGTQNCKLILQLLDKKLKLEMLLPNHVIEKYNIDIGRKIRVSLKKSCIAVLGSGNSDTTVNEGMAVI